MNNLYIIDERPQISQPPTPADELLTKFRRLEKIAEALLKGLAQ